MSHVDASIAPASAPCDMALPSSSQDDALHEECGVFGVWAPGLDVARLTYFGLKALQHRGQESAGIAVGDGGTVMVRKDLGLLDQVFSNADLEFSHGRPRHRTCALRHGGRQKAGSPRSPHLSTINDVIIALAHNGPLEYDELRRQLIDLGVSFMSSSDSEVATRLIGYFTQRTSHLREGIRKTMELVRGGYAMTLINEHALYAFRDPSAFARLCLAACRWNAKRGTAPNVTLRSPLGLRAGSLHPRPARSISLAPQYVEHPPRRNTSHQRGGARLRAGVPAARESAECIFEQVYFARPDSIMAGKSVYACRYDIGPAVCARGARRCRYGHRRSGQRLAAGGGLCTRERNPLRRGAHQKPLCRAHLHPADAGCGRACA